MNGCLTNSWTDLMVSRSRRWIKAKDMLDPSKCWLGLQRKSAAAKEEEVGSRDQWRRSSSSKGVGSELAKECGSLYKFVHGLRASRVKEASLVERPEDRMTCGSLSSEEHPELPARRARVFTWRVKNALEGIAI
ncbi:hypothetical protein EJB05_49054, partial [Eragrostis curvula]